MAHTEGTSLAIDVFLNIFHTFIHGQAISC